MTKTYKVLKDFPSSDGGFEHKVGKTYKPSQSETRTKALERLGYIKEIPKEPKTVWDLKVGDIYYVIEHGRVVSGHWNYGDYTPERCAGDMFLSLDISLAEPGDECANSPYCKNDFINHKTWALWIEEYEDSLSRKPVGIYFGETLAEIKEKLKKYEPIFMEVKL